MNGSEKIQNQQSRRQIRDSWNIETSRQQVTNTTKSNFSGIFYISFWLKSLVLSEMSQNWIVDCSNKQIQTKAERTENERAQSVYINRPSQAGISTSASNIRLFSTILSI